MSQLHDILGSLHSKMIRYTSLNYGGCGIVAERMYTRLVELGYKPNILCSNSMWCNEVRLDDIRDNLSMNGIDTNCASNWTDEDGDIISFNHVFLHINEDGKDLYFDGCEFIDISPEGKMDEYGDLMDGELFIDELRSFLDEGSWNPRFFNHHTATGVRRVITQTIRQFA